MSRLLVTIALLLASCAGLRTHALVAVSSAAVLADVGNAIQADSDAELAKLTDDAQRAVWYATWSPVAAKYARTKSALLAYEAAIAKADQLGDDSLVAAPARALLVEWQQLAALADAYGVGVIGPPQALTNLARAP